MAEISAPINALLPTISTWITAKGISLELSEPRYCVVLCEQSFEPGETELRSLWPEGVWLSWFGGPAVLPLDQWPRRHDGHPLAHVASIQLDGVYGAADSQDKQSWPQPTDLLPREGVLEVFHDLQSFGFEATEKQQQAWQVRWVQPDRSGFAEPPQDLDLPHEFCQVALPMHSFSTKSLADHLDLQEPHFTDYERMEQEIQESWTLQRGLNPNPPVPFSHIYGHSQRGYLGVKDYLQEFLPLEEPDQYVLVLDLESWTHLEGWFGDVGNLEVWMRESDLRAQDFGKAWCFIRTD